MARSKALTRAVRRYKSWLHEEEISYPNRFFVQLGASAALFLLLFGLKQVQAQPVQTALSGIRNVATTDMELGRTIGKLEFVGNFVPESVMVFWNAEDKTLSDPFEDAVMLVEQEGWAVFEGRDAVISGGEGTVEKVESCDGNYSLIVKYDNGLTCTLQPLRGVRVAAGERVHEGQSVGVAMSAGNAVQVRMKVMDGDTPLSAKEWRR